MAGRKLESAAQFQVGFVYSGHTVCLLWGASLCSLSLYLVKGSLSLVIFFYLMGWLLCVGQSPRTSWLRGLLLDVTVGKDLVVEPVAVTFLQVVIQLQHSLLDWLIMIGYHPISARYALFGVILWTMLIDRHSLACRV